MAMATDRTAAFAVPAAAALLLWPALWNGYPIVFADTGTYLSQAIHRYAGWDRPVFYSAFILPLHLTLTLWPVIVAQALLAALVLWTVCRTLLPGLAGWAFVGGVALLSVGSWLPWLVCEIMPDLFTPLLVLLLALPGRRGGWLLVAATALMIACQQSSLPLSIVLLTVLGWFAGVGGSGTRPGVVAGEDRPATAGGVWAGKSNGWRAVWLAPIVAILGLCAVNLAAHGRFAVAPFGNVFVLARTIYDGPGMTALTQACPTRHWRLCPFIDAFPPTSDDFLWTPDSPLNRAGGPKIVSLEADAIIRSAFALDTPGLLRGALDDSLRQLWRFASGDGLNAWPTEVSSWIERDFPRREAAAYQRARQQNGLLAVPPALAVLHEAAALAGVAACIVLLPLAWRRRAVCAAFLLAVLLALPVSAAITGSLSTPHDRYQSRIMWLPPFIAVASLASLRRRWA